MIPPARQWNVRLSINVSLIKIVFNIKYNITAKIRLSNYDYSFEVLSGMFALLEISLVRK